MNHNFPNNLPHWFGVQMTLPKKKFHLILKINNLTLIMISSFSTFVMKGAMCGKFGK